MARERQNSGFDAFRQLPNGERVFVQVMTKCAQPFGLDTKSPFGQRVLERTAQVYKELRANNRNPHINRCFIEALWGLATLDQAKDKLNLREIKMTNPSLPPSERFPDVRKIQSIGIPEGAIYTFRQAHGIVAKDGKSTRVSYYSAQQEGHTPISFFLYHPPADLTIFNVQSFRPYEDRTIEISHPHNPQATRRRQQQVARFILSLPIYDPTKPSTK